MIKLSKVPMEGGCLKFQLSFKDNYGKYYVPLSVNYTFLALNKDKVSWCVVDNLYQKSLEPSSIIMLTIQKLQTVIGTTSQRKVIVAWSALVDGQVTEFVDEVTFEIQPKPYITNVPEVEPVEPLYVKVTDVDMQVGYKTSSPVNPVFYVSLNYPVSTSESTIKFHKGTTEINSFFTLDSTHTKLTVTPSVSLDNDSSYTLSISGLKSLVGSFGMSENFSYAFATDDKVYKEIASLDERVKALENPQEEEDDEETI